MVHLVHPSTSIACPKCHAEIGGSCYLPAPLHALSPQAAQYIHHERIEAWQEVEQRMLERDQALRSDELEARLGTRTEMLREYIDEIRNAATWCSGPREEVYKEIADELTHRFFKPTRRGFTHPISAAGDLEEIGVMNNGHTLYRKPNVVGGHLYLSDENSIMALAWDTSQISEETLLTAILLEKLRLRKESKL